MLHCGIGRRGYAGAMNDFIGQRHSPAEDIYALVVGCVLVVLGLVLLRAAGLVTGGVAGIALLVSYVVPPPPACSSPCSTCPSS
jgi:hypothetical protein